MTREDASWHLLMLHTTLGPNRTSCLGRIEVAEMTEYGLSVLEPMRFE